MKKTYSIGSKLVAALTAAGVIGMGCTTADDPEATGDPGAREVTLDVWTNLPDDKGVRQRTQLGTTTTTLDELLDADRVFVADGAESSDLATLWTASEIVVPLNTGETATLVRKGDRLELASFTGEDDGTGDMPRGAVSAVRLLPDGIDVFLAGSDSAEADTTLRLSGLEDLDAERSELVASLSLDAMLVSLEDGEQIAPPVAIALIAAVVGSFWLAICGGLAWECATRCEYWTGFETQCAGITVTVNPTTVTGGGGYSCRCI